MKHRDFNEQQQSATEALHGVNICLAGAGTGKTKTLLGRFNSLLESGIPLKKILCTTFTVEGAKVMAKRAGLPKEQTTFCTFHSLGYRIILAERELLHFPLSDDPVQPKARARLIFRLIKKYGIEDFKSLESYLSRMKRFGLDPRQALDMGGELDSYSYARAYEEYDRIMRQEGWLDFDSMLTESLHLLRTNPAVRDRWQFQAIQVDETQDTDDIQFKMVQELSAVHRNVFMVGDPNQAIYEWRGASPKNMLDAAKWFDSPRYIYLTQNYRSTQTIVDYCKKHAPIQTEQVRLMTSARGIVGDPIEYGFYSNADAEAEAAILRALKNPGGTAILGRTNRLLGTVEDLCQESKTKYNLLGKSGFWRQEEVQNVMAYVCFAVNGSDAALKKIINAPFRPTQGIAKRDLLRVLKDNQDAAGIYTPLFRILKSIAPQLEQREKVGKLVRLLEHIRDSRTANAADSVQHIIECVEAEGHYDDAETEDNYALENIRTLAKRAAKFRSLEDFVEHARKCTNAPKARKDVLTISTIHQAKGQEWTNVIVIGVADGMLPHKKGDPDEEARIFYVAISRPADNLRLTYAGLPSKYIMDELPKERVPENEQRRLIAEKATQVPLFDFGGKV